MKILCNLCNKSNNLWIQWNHTYYVKNDSIRQVTMKENQYSIMKHVLKLREKYQNLQQMNIIGDNFNMKVVYKAMYKDVPRVS